MSILGMAAATAGAKALDQGLGMINQDRQQQKQQEQMDYQQKLNKEMFDYSYNKTNTTAQMEQLKKNALNPTLMYGSGAGGTIQTTTGGIGDGNVGMIQNDGTARSLEAATELGLMNAQKSNIEADTEKKKADADKTKGVDTEQTLGAIEKLKADTENVKMQTKLTEIEASIQMLSGTDQVETINKQAKILGEQLEQLQRENNIGNETMNEIINEIKEKSENQRLQNEMLKAGINLTNEQSKSIIENIKQKWTEIGIEEEQNKISWDNLDNNKKNTAINAFKEATAAEYPDIWKVGGKLIDKAARGIYNSARDFDKAIGRKEPGNRNYDKRDIE